jgi:hypothetical protein
MQRETVSSANRNSARNVYLEVKRDVYMKPATYLCSQYIFVCAIDRAMDSI